MANITIIGAGSAQFSGGIIRDLCVTPSLHGSTLTLMDIDEKRLKFITEMAKKLTAELGAQLTFKATTDRIESLKGADFVINTAQDQGHPWQNKMEAITAKHGFYRSGILSHVYNSAFLLDVAKDVEKYCPDAWLIQSSNPVFEGCTVIHRKTNVKCIGLCHGHYGYRDVAKVLGLDWHDCTAKMFGFNHWIWMTDFRYKGEDAYPILDRWIKEEAEEYWKKDRHFADQQMSRAAIEVYKMMGKMPIGDTPRVLDCPRQLGWIFNGSNEVKHYWFSQQGGFDSEEGWGAYLEELEQNVKTIESVATDPNKKVTDVFEPKQSDEQIVPIIESLLFDKQKVYQVNVPNRGHIVEGFPEDIVVECEALISGAGVQPIHMGRLPSRIMAGAMNPRYMQCELISDFICTGDPEALRLTLLYDHSAASLDQVDSIMKEFLECEENWAIRKILKK